MAFHVGQKVQCIKRGAWASLYNLPRQKDPQYGDLLTVREILDDEDGCFLRFKEIQNPETAFVEEACFAADKFRPLQEQGMSTLRAIAANPKRELESV